MEAAQARVMVCVTRQKTCERLIRNGAKISREMGLALSVVHVVPTGSNFLGNPHEGEALEYLFSISKEHGADMSVLKADQVVDTLVAYAQENAAAVIVMGDAPGGGSAIVRELHRRLRDVDFRILPAR